MYSVTFAFKASFAANSYLWPPGSVEAGPHLGSWRKRCLISYEKGQKAQKGQKKRPKSTFFGLTLRSEPGSIDLLKEPHFVAVGPWSHWLRPFLFVPYPYLPPVLSRAFVWIFGFLLVGSCVFDWKFDAEPPSLKLWRDKFRGFCRRDNRIYGDFILAGFGVPSKAGSATLSESLFDASIYRSFVHSRRVPFRPGAGLSAQRMPDPICEAG